jgi:molybdopterin molybdotransferase
MKTLVSVDEAIAQITAKIAAQPAETVAVADAAGRVLARDVVSAIDQPPFRASAMDGYAVRFEDVRAGARLKLIGEAAAGAPFTGVVGAGAAVRIFTGGAVPSGADHIVIQEDTSADSAYVTINETPTAKSHIREEGIDFKKGAVVKPAGARLTPLDLGLIAAANIAEVETVRKPRIAFFDNGDELVEPGAALGAGQIVGSNRIAMEALITLWGGAPDYLGRAADDRKAISRIFEQAQGADALVPIGGASVGDHDLVRGAFADAGGEMIFSKVSVRPGKPTWFGAMGRTRVLGLPGNPASAMVCAMVFLRPLIAALSGQGKKTGYLRAALAAPLDANGARETFLRGRIEADATARLTVRAAAAQDSSLMTPLSQGNCLIRRTANAPAADAGALVDCLPYASLASGAAL